MRSYADSAKIITAQIDANRNGHILMLLVNCSDRWL